MSHRSGLRLSHLLSSERSSGAAEWQASLPVRGNLSAGFQFGMLPNSRRLEMFSVIPRRHSGSWSFPTSSARSAGPFMAHCSSFAPATRLNLRWCTGSFPCRSIRSRGTRRSRPNVPPRRGGFPSTRICYLRNTTLLARCHGKSLQRAPESRTRHCFENVAEGRPQRRAWMLMLRLEPNSLSQAHRHS